mgnify:CR=1 FL=1
MTPAIQTPTIKPMTDAAIDAVREIEARVLACEQAEIHTVHVIHAGLYSRTIRIQKSTLVTGALVKIPTVLTISGHCSVLVDGELVEFVGYHTIPASAWRKQVFYAHEDTFVTMTFPTTAQTVEQAEAAFTDEFNNLMSRSVDTDLVIITGE